MKDYEEYEKPDNCLNLYEKPYETIEFLGDSILGSIVTKYLYHRFVDYHDQAEGFLTKIKIRLVCGEQLSFLSKRLGFEKFMIISKHIEENCSGRNNTHILEDIYEAFIGALYLDSNDYQLVEKFIVQSIEKNIDIADMILNDNNYKDQILRYFQHNFKIFPIYKTIKDEENNVFECKLYKNEEHIGTGIGNTKKKAEQEASKNSLIHYRVISN